jgi:hypothetical protein
MMSFKNLKIKKVPYKIEELFLDTFFSTKKYREIYNYISTFFHCHPSSASGCIEPKRLVLGNSTTHLTNDAKISKLAALRHLKFLRLLIVEGPSLKFP